MNYCELVACAKPEADHDSIQMSRSSMKLKKTNFVLQLQPIKVYSCRRRRHQQLGIAFPVVLVQGLPTIA